MSVYRTDDIKIFTKKGIRIGTVGQEGNQMECSPIRKD